jgi:hypothetical protein
MLGIHYAKTSSTRQSAVIEDQSLLDMDELKFQWLPVAKNTSAFSNFKFISTRLFWRHSRASSSRLSIVNGPFEPLPASILERRTQSRRAVFVSFKSLATCPLLRPPTWQRSTLSAFKAEVNERALRSADFFDLFMGGLLARVLANFAVYGIGGGSKRR